MAQVKQNIRQMSLVINKDLYELLDHMAQETGQPKSYIIETYMSRGMLAWYEKNEPDSPAYLNYQSLTQKREI